MITNDVISGSTIYWITRLDSIQNALMSLMLVSLFIYVAAFCYWNDADEKRAKEYRYKDQTEVARYSKLCDMAKRYMRISIVVGFLAFTGRVFTPSKTDMAAILVIPALANNEEVQGMASEVTNLAREWLQELRPETKE